MMTGACHLYCVAQEKLGRDTGWTEHVSQKCACQTILLSHQEVHFSCKNYMIPQLRSVLNPPTPHPSPHPWQQAAKYSLPIPWLHINLTTSFCRFMIWLLFYFNASVLFLMHVLPCKMMSVRTLCWLQQHCCRPNFIFNLNTTIKCIDLLLVFLVSGWRSSEVLTLTINIDIQLSKFLGQRKC